MKIMTPMRPMKAMEPMQPMEPMKLSGRTGRQVKMRPQRVELPTTPSRRVQRKADPGKAMGASSSTARKRVGR